MLIFALQFHVTNRMPDHKAAAPTAVRRIGCHVVKTAYLLDDAPRSSCSCCSPYHRACGSPSLKTTYLCACFLLSTTHSVVVCQCGCT